jgi:hypothetical protein
LGRLPRLSVGLHFNYSINLNPQMQDLVIEAKDSKYLIPQVNFSAATGTCWLAGESYLGNTYEFYRQLQNWLETYTQTIRKSIIFNIKLIYMNTSSQRALLDLFAVLKLYQTQGGQVVLNWYYLKDDEDQIAEAEDFARDIELAINLIPYQLAN